MEERERKGRERLKTGREGRRKEKIQSAAEKLAVQVSVDVGKSRGGEAIGDSDIA